MSQEKPRIGDLIKKLQTGELPAYSKEGINAIRMIAESNPSDVALKLFRLPNNALERGMRGAGMSEDDIEEMLRLGDDAEDPEDPFTDAVEFTPDPAQQDRMEKGPFEYDPDPAAEMRNGPRPR